jgi:hypothetical protein
MRVGTAAKSAADCPRHKNRIKLYRFALSF